VSRTMPGSCRCPPPTRSLARPPFEGGSTAVAVSAAREAALARTVGRLRLSARSQGVLRPVHGSFASQLAWDALGRRDRPQRSRIVRDQRRRRPAGRR
jgi:hypothetical protein